MGGVRTRGLGLILLGLGLLLLGRCFSGGEASSVDPASNTGEEAMVFPEVEEDAAWDEASRILPPPEPVAAVREEEEVDEAAEEPAAPGTPARSGLTAWDRVGGLDDGLQARVERRIAEARKQAGVLGGKSVAPEQVVVSMRALDLAGGKGLVGVRSRERMRPASNQKVLTVAAALALLGAGAELETPFHRGRDARIEGHRLVGDLVAIAGADPVYDPEGDGSVDAWLAPLVAELRDLGIEEITGDLVLDEGAFMEPGPAPEWPAASEHWQEYCALAGGFSANAGCLQANLPARPVGQAVPVRLEPRGHGLTERLGVRSVSAKGRLDVRIGVAGERATVQGELPVSVGDWSARFRHPDPVALFGGAVREALRDAGVLIRGEVRRERGFEVGPRIAVCRSAVAEHLVPILRDSNNSVADQLWLATAQRSEGLGDRGAGAAAVHRALEALGLAASGQASVDGSGLSRANRTSTRQLAAVLAALSEREPDLASLLASLPVAGLSGSLEGRMGGTPAEGRVLAKTGFISGTSGLSGFVLEEGRPRIAFSILVAYPPAGGLNTKVFKPMQDDLCLELLAWIDR
ncbi:MAG: D-alanyl-D-alanine carboxypeptidase/D-alanyl-D-alanine-endopeptidase [Planctomycetota bacterium]|nr:D-alanyl-D-alanine carboxypeptidase/D-alanyl-D-alanine-endopeptidase [Planctomycetota bacterium]